MIRRAPGTAVAEREKARRAASGLGRPEMADEMTERMRALMEVVGSGGWIEAGKQMDEGGFEGVSAVVFSLGEG